MSDYGHEILRDFHGGNTKAFETLFRRYKNPIYNFAYKMLGNKEAAGDVTQDVFIKLFKSRDNPGKINHLKSWLFVLTRNLCLNQIRDAKNEIGLESIEAENPTGKEASAWESIKLQRALSDLEPDLKEVLILREYQGFSYAEIAEILGMSVGGVKALLYKARIRLKEIYEKSI